MVVTFDWNDIRETVVYKEDLFGYDEICLGFRITDSDEYIRLGKSCAEYPALLKRLEPIFPIFVRRRYLRYLPDVTNRDIAMDLIQRLPEDTPRQDIATEIEFIAGDREGLEQIEQGERVPAEEVRRMIPSWITR